MANARFDGMFVFQLKVPYRQNSKKDQANVPNQFPTVIARHKHSFLSVWEGRILLFVPKGEESGEEEDDSFLTFGLERQK